MSFLLFLNLFVTFLCYGLQTPVNHFPLFVSQFPEQQSLPFLQVFSQRDRHFVLTASDTTSDSLPFSEGLQTPVNHFPLFVSQFPEQQSPPFLQVFSQSARQHETALKIKIKK